LLLKDADSLGTSQKIANQQHWDNTEILLYVVVRQELTRNYRFQKVEKR